MRADAPIHSRRAAVAVFLGIVGSFSVVRYLYEETTVYHINSIGSSSILFLKVLYDRFRSFDFLPALWTNLYGSGGPIAVGPTSFNPVILAVSWLQPFEYALMGYEVLMRVLGAFGMYAFLRRNQTVAPAALVGGGLWALNVFTMTAGQDPQIGQSILLLPWILLAAQHAVERPSWPAASAMSISLVVFYFVATTQVSLSAGTSLIAPFAAGILIVRGVQPATPLPLFRRIVLPPLFLAAAAVALMAIVSFDLVQQLDNLSLGSKGLRVSTIFGDYLFLFLPMLGVSLLLHVLVASRWMLTRALGLGLVLFGYWSTLRMLRLDPATILWANVGGTGLDEFIFDLQLPKYVFTAGPVFLGALAAWDIFKQAPRNAGAILLLCVGSAFGLMPFVLPAIPDYYVTRCIFVPLLGYSAFAALGADRILGRVARSAPHRCRFAALALIVLVMGEAMNVAWRQTLYTPGIKYTRMGSPEMNFLSTLGPTERVIDEYEDENTREWAQNVPFRRAALPRWLIPAYADAQTFSRIGVSLVQNDYQEFYERALHSTYFGSKIGQWSPLLDVASVTHLIAHDPPAADFVPRLEGPDYTIYENPHALPRVQVYDSAIALDNTAGLQHLETRAATGASFAAVVAVEQAALIGDLDQGKGGTARVTTATDERIVISTTLRGRSLVVLADTYYPGWRAWVDGQSATVLRTNVAFRGVVVESGHHTIEFRYEPRLHTPLLSLAVIAAAIQAAMLFAGASGGRRHRHAVAEDSPASDSVGLREGT